jgi:hypothetical protein
MKAVDSRLSKLENQFGIARDAPKYVVRLMLAGQVIGPAEEAYIESEAKRIAPGCFGLVDLRHFKEPGKQSALPLQLRPKSVEPTE